MEKALTYQDWLKVQKEEAEAYFVEKEAELKKLKQQLNGTVVLKTFGEMIRKQAKRSTAEKALTKWYGIDEVTQPYNALLDNRQVVVNSEIAKEVKPLLFKLAENGFIETELVSFKTKAQYGRGYKYAKVTYDNKKRMWRITEKGIKQLQLWAIKQA